MFNRFIEKPFLVNIFCALQILTYILSLVSGSLSITAISMVFILVNAVFISIVHFNKVNVIGLILFIFTTTVFIISSLFTSNEYTDKYSYIIIGINSFLISILFRGPSALRIIYILSWSVNLCVIYLGIKSNFNPNFGNEIFAYSSRNIVSAYLIFGTIYYLFFCLIENKKINLFLIFLFTINCIILFGRSGIGLSILILIYSLYKRLGNIYVILLISAAFTSFGIFYQLILESTNFSSGLDTPRLLLYKEYFNLMSEKDFFLGRSINQCCSLIVSYGRNPHNSFIFGHMIFGITHTIFVIVIFLTILTTKKLEIIFFTTLLYIRYMLDQIGLFYYFDIVLFSIFIYSYKSLLKIDERDI